MIPIRSLTTAHANSHVVSLAEIGFLHPAHQRVASAEVLTVRHRQTAVLDHQARGSLSTYPFPNGSDDHHYHQKFLPTEMHLTIPFLKETLLLRLKLFCRELKES